MFTTARLFYIAHETIILQQKIKKQIFLYSKKYMFLFVCLLYRQQQNLI